MKALEDIQETRTISENALMTFKKETGASFF